MMFLDETEQEVSSMVLSIINRRRPPLPYPPYSLRWEFPARPSIPPHQYNNTKTNNNNTNNNALQSKTPLRLTTTTTTTTIWAPDDCFGGILWQPKVAKGGTREVSIKKLAPRVLIETFTAARLASNWCPWEPIWPTLGANWHALGPWCGPLGTLSNTSFWQNMWGDAANHSDKTNAETNLWNTENLKHKNAVNTNLGNNQKQIPETTGTSNTRTQRSIHQTNVKNKSLNHRRPRRRLQNVPGPR